MSNYIDKYRKRVNQNATNIGDSLKTRSQNYYNGKFLESPNFRKALVSSFEFPDIKEIDIHTTSIERMGGIKNVVFRPNETLGYGSYLTFDSSTWLIYDLFKNTVATKAIVQECNSFLRWTDGEGNLYEKPCYSGASDLGSKAKQSRSEVAWNKYDVRLATGQLFCYVEKDLNSSKIEIDQRLIFGDKVYKVVGYDGTTLTNVEGKGVVYFMLQLTPSRESDDFVNGIADNILVDNNGEVTTVALKMSSRMSMTTDIEDESSDLTSWGKRG